MIADPKRKPHQDNGDSDKRRRQEEALDEALRNTFPASDPVSVEQPTTSGRPVVPDPCPSRKSNPRVAMMQSGQDGRDYDGPRPLDGSS